MISHTSGYAFIDVSSDIFIICAGIRLWSREIINSHLRRLSDMAFSAQLYWRLSMTYHSMSQSRMQTIEQKAISLIFSRNSSKRRLKRRGTEAMSGIDATARAPSPFYRCDCMRKRHFTAAFTSILAASKWRWRSFVNSRQVLKDDDTQAS